jgi:hypothetical protein
MTASHRKKSENALLLSFTQIKVQIPWLIWKAALSKCMATLDLLAVGIKRTSVVTIVWCVSHHDQHLLRTKAGVPLWDVSQVTKRWVMLLGFDFYCFPVKDA